MLTKEHKSKRMAVLAPPDFNFFSHLRTSYQEKDLRTKTHCKKQLCNTSHTLERNTTMRECLHLQNDGINVWMLTATLTNLMFFSCNKNVDVIWFCTFKFRPPSKILLTQGVDRCHAFVNTVLKILFPNNAWGVLTT
jgi:hypothetical protein